MIAVELCEPILDAGTEDGATALQPDLVGAATAADLKTVDDCPALSRLRAFVIPQHSYSLLNWTMRRPSGAVLPLTTDDDADTESGSSESGSDSADAAAVFWTVTVRVRQALATGTPSSDATRLYAVPGAIVDAAAGEVQAPLPPIITKTPGVYAVSWGVYDQDARLLHVNQTWLFVERNLFGGLSSLGPPTVQEIRLAVMDTVAENYWLDDVEFDGADIAQAIVRPIQYWNETPPPIARYQLHNFPFREHWLKGIVGYLLEAAAHNYRRNRVAHSAGGVALDDKNKGPEYLQVGREVRREFESWVARKKYELNIKKMRGYIGSDYGRY